MDELLQHCLRELAFDGDLGCDVSRLRDFVGEFYTSHISMRQTLDDSYYAFIWSLVAQQPSVRVGTLPEGQSSEVYIPPQPRVGKKNKGGQDDGQQDLPSAVRLELIPDATIFPLNELVQRYGARLRIAVDPETCFVAITGSHAKPAKLTPMVYASLQLIARAREAGLSVLELGKSTGYDQKTCFYLVKQLLELDLVVKLRRGGTSQNFCVHKYFFDCSPTWKQIREEEVHAQEEFASRGKSENGLTGGDSGTLDPLHFDPIDTRHLTSLNILRQRLVKLLKHSLNETQLYTNIAVRIGFRPRSRTDRRFFIARLKELIHEGTIEKVFVASANPDTTQNRQLCLRLVSSKNDAEANPDDGAIRATDDEEKEEDMIESLMTEDLYGDRTHVKSTMTLHKQILDLIQESSTTGITLNELSDRLGSFDKRTLELLVSRMERQAPPPHLADLSVIQVLETRGRERRYRFFTLSGYSQLMAREGFELPSGRYTSQDLGNAGRFMEVREIDFYESHDALLKYLSKWSGKGLGRPQKVKDTVDQRGPSAKKPKNIKVAAEGGPVNLTSRKEKGKDWTNPLLPDGTRKRGRPVKGTEAAEKRKQKRRRKDYGAEGETAGDGLADTGGNGHAAPVRRKTIKRKSGSDDHPESEAEIIDAEVEESIKDGLQTDSTQVHPKRRRGRPPKKKQCIFNDDSSQLPSATPLPDDIVDSNAPGSAPAKLKRRTPKRKNKDVETTEVATTSEPSPPCSAPHLSSPQPPSLPLSSSTFGSISSPGSPFVGQAQSFSSSAHHQDRLPIPAQSLTDQAGHSVPSTLLETIAAFKGPSQDNIGQPILADEVTKAIATLAAQVRETLSTSNAQNDTETQLPPLTPAQVCVNDTTASVSHFSAQHSIVRPSVENVPETQQEGMGQSAGSEASMRNEMLDDGLYNTGTNDDHADGASTMDVYGDAGSQNSIAVSDVSVSHRSREQSGSSEIKPRKGLSARFLGKTNLTAMRRENELVQLLKNAGGIVNISTNEFLRAFMEFIEVTVKAGETTSAPVGTTMDRRTLNYSLDKLVSSGRIRTVTTSISSITGGSRSSKIAYLPTVSDEQLGDYIAAQVATVGSVARRQDSERDRRLAIKKSKLKKQAEMKSRLAQKGVEAIKMRENSWDDMVEKVHPGLLKGVAATRLRKLRQSYSRGSIVQDNHQWELQIAEAIKTAKKTRMARNLFPSVSHIIKSQQQPAIDTSLPRNADHSRPVELLINMQKDTPGENKEPEEVDFNTESDRKGAKDTAHKGTRSGRVRRQRFQWNPEFDELARDASVIIRARCRTHHRLEWAALDQVFPSIPRNSVRVRISVLKEQPGAEAYLQRLENYWHELWVKKRGTPELPDANPLNPTDFDLKFHLEYLRNHVDKNSIRVGISNDEEETHFVMPADPIEFSSSWTLIERGPVHAHWEFLLNNVIGEEARERLFLEGAFVMENEPFTKEDMLPDSVTFAESALKMVIGTPNEIYDANLASTLLRGIGEREITVAMDDLLSRNVLSKLVRDTTRLVPGRTVKISEMNQNALGGSLPRDFFQDASQLEESYALDINEWREWPLVSTDGDTAAILQQISDHKVGFELNTSHAQATRALVDGNSRKVDDYDIELGIKVKFSDISLPPKDTASATDNSQSSLEAADAFGHGLSILGGGACCKIATDGVVDCLMCIKESYAQLDNWTEQDRHLAHSIIDRVESRMMLGIKIEELMTTLQNECADDLCMAIIHRLCILRVPILYFTGYSSSLVVSAKFIGSWAVTLPGLGQPVTKIFPRRWLDIAAERIPEVWDAALRAVVGLVHLRPGISQAELRWRLKSVYDRQETIDVLKHLMSNKSLRPCLDANFGLAEITCLEAISEREEAVHWFVREEKHWYQIF